MKKNQFFVITLFALVINLSSVLASENSTDALSSQMLGDQLTRVFYSSPLEDLLDKKSENITVIFKINQDQQFELIQVNGENKDLVRYATILLTNRKIKVDASVKVKSYILPVKFVNQ
jgi:hypothetical protein